MGQQERPGTRQRPELSQERLEYEVAQEIGVDPEKARQSRTRRKGRGGGGGGGGPAPTNPTL